MPSPASPDPARGLFETLLVADGRAVRAAAHLDRLEASAREVFGQALPPDLPAAIDAAAAPLDLGRMRIDLRGSIRQSSAVSRSVASFAGEASIAGNLETP
jgi:plasmid stability protein